MGCPPRSGIGDRLGSENAFDLAVAAIALYATPKGVHGQMIDDLRENEFAYIHGPCPPAIPQEHGELGFSISNR